ncbi:hypothetical protein [Ruegeria atlantica]|uniref:Putative PEP-CTERM system TPR-repeat lipoprotein n=1 Tax=Ruegeria atlantica TaxID=81569 RepID=A0A0P1ELJ7_9RHOB|nr:hypothetical protein [Ruegeria atlantica]CUH43879.1 putative PEP-CTERM system TPR-repeat lipoprotein [Ruegeria atlantica]
MSAAKGVFVGQRKDRMGARLLMMLTCIRLAEDFGTTYRVNWFPQGADAPELDHPKELFAQDWLDEHFLTPKEFGALSQNALPIWSFQSDTSPDRLIAHLNAGRSVLVEEGFEVLAFPWEDVETIRPRYRDFIHRVGFTEEIREIMDCADARLSGQGVSAYHIRRGDILNGLPWKHTTWPAKIEPEELYEAHLAKNADKAAIMFSDQPELVFRFQKKFPHLLQMSDIADVSGMTRAKRDFLELYTMSRADQVIAPVISAFSMAAARISGQQRKVFRDVLTEEEISQANERAIQRLQAGLNGFLNTSEAAHIYAKVLTHMNRLHSDDRHEEASDIASRLQDEGADNAFLPLLQALNSFYANKWEEAAEMVEMALLDPNIWPEDHAVARALRAAVLGTQKKRWMATREFSLAFWAKPLRPDVTIFGSRLLFRDQLAFRALPPIDWAVQKSIRRSWFSFNTHVAQLKVIARRPCNFDLILLDWSILSLDERARRLTGNKERLLLLQDGLEAMKNFLPNAESTEQSPEHKSLATILNVHLGRIRSELAIDVAQWVCAQRPDNPLYLKRLSELYEAAGDNSRARLAMADALASDPGNPFLIFAMGCFLERIGAVEQAHQQVLEAADIDDNTAAIQGAAGQLLLRQGEKAKARKYLARAQDLCPKFKRFSNQLKRAGG